MRHAHAIGSVTQAGVRTLLHRAYGVEFARSPRTGVWEVAAIPQATLELFSSRHVEITEVLATLGYATRTTSAAEDRVITRATRRGKTELIAAPDTTLRAYWRDKAIAAGQNPDDWLPLVWASTQGRDPAAWVEANTSVRARHGVSLDELVARLSDPAAGLTGQKRRFSHLDALCATAEALPRGASIEEIEQLTAAVLSHPVFLPLERDGGWGADPDTNEPPPTVTVAGQLAGS